MKDVKIGVDVGGTTVKIGIFKNNEEPILKWEIKTDTTNHGEKILPDVAASIIKNIEKNAIRKDRIKGVGVGVPGPVVNFSLVTKNANIGWENKNVARELSVLLDLPVVVANDANMAALGEGRDGDVLMVTLGTGVGGGIINDGQIIEGKNGAAGEIGHFIVNPNETRQCKCGRFGCLEQYVSATGVLSMAKDRGLKYISAKEVFEAAAIDTSAAKVVAEVGRILGQALANICSIINPETVVIGGGVSRAGDALLNPVRDAFYKNCLFTCQETKIVSARLYNDAGICGAAILAEKKL